MPSASYAAAMRRFSHPLVAAVLGVVLAGVIGIQAHALATGGLPEAPPASLAIAHDFAVAATSFDFRRIESDIDRVLAFGDDAFAESFAAVRGEDFGRDIVAARRVSVGEVVAGPTVQRVTDRSAVVLVVVDQRVASLAEDGAAAGSDLVRVAMLVTVQTDPDDPRVRAVELL
jgi:hypothetical protein